MAESSSSTQLLIELTTHTLLFLLIFGMSATVDSNNLRRQLSNKDAILTGVAMQFIIMPLLGFIAVYTLKDHGLTTAMGLSLLIVTSSPGGSYSNWWCSLFNADLALSVAMTALSTILSTALLPANLILYSYLAYGLGGEKSVLGSINFGKLFVSIAIVIVAIIAGLYASFTVDSSKFRKVSNHMGSVSGILLIVFSAVFSSTSEADATPWSHPWSFYVATVLPCLFGLAISNLIAARLVQLDKPEVVTLSIECCYQNVGIATSAAVAMFDNSRDVAEALAVALVYGMVEVVVLGTYCIFAWKMGWTKAPKDAPFLTVLCTSFEIERNYVDSSSNNNMRGWKCCIGERGQGVLIEELDEHDETVEQDIEFGERPIFNFDPNSIHGMNGRDGVDGEDNSPKTKCTDKTEDFSISEDESKKTYAENKTTREVEITRVGTDDDGSVASISGFVETSFGSKQVRPRTQEANHITNLNQRNWGLPVMLNRLCRSSKAINSMVPQSTDSISTLGRGCYRSASDNAISPPMTARETLDGFDEVDPTDIIFCKK